jgi:hypothetical protein
VNLDHLHDGHVRLMLHLASLGLLALLFIALGVLRLEALFRHFAGFAQHFLAIHLLARRGQGFLVVLGLVLVVEVVVFRVLGIELLAFVGLLPLLNILLLRPGEELQRAFRECGVA